MANIQITNWPVEAMCGYKPKTTFWQDFCIADAFGANAVKDTYRRAFRDWHTNTEYITELVMVLNHKIWQHYEAKNRDLAYIYDQLWRELDDWCRDNLTGEAAQYYFETTD